MLIASGGTCAPVVRNIPQIVTPAHQPSIAQGSPVPPGDNNSTLPVINTIFITPLFQFPTPKVAIPKIKKKRKPAKPRPPPRMKFQDEVSIPVLFRKYDRSDNNIASQNRGSEFKLTLPAVFGGVDTFSNEVFHTIRTEDKVTKIMVNALMKDNVLITTITHDYSILFLDRFHELIRIHGDELQSNRDISAALLACLKQKGLRPCQVNDEMLEKSCVNSATIKGMKLLSIVVGTRHFLIYATPIITTEGMCTVYTKHGALILEQNYNRFMALTQTEYSELLESPNLWSDKKCST